MMIASLKVPNIRQQMTLHKYSEKSQVGNVKYETISQF